jgi:hypothetical protein
VGITVGHIIIGNVFLGDEVDAAIYCKANGIEALSEHRLVTFREVDSANRYSNSGNTQQSQQ